MWVFDDWHDWFRLANLFICLTALGILASRYYRQGRSYNQKTIDIWYSFILWLVTGIVVTCTALVRDAPLTPVPVAIFAASSFSLKAILRGGSWGYTSGH